MAARGGALLPGLHDHHLHLLALAARRAGVRVDEAPDPEAFDRAVLTGPVTRDHPGGRAWLRVTGYDEHRHGPLGRRRLDALGGPPGRAGGRPGPAPERSVVVPVERRAGGGRSRRRRPAAPRGRRRGGAGPVRTSDGVAPPPRRLARAADRLAAAPSRAGRPAPGRPRHHRRHRDHALARRRRARSAPGSRNRPVPAPAPGGARRGRPRRRSPGGRRPARSSSSPTSSEASIRRASPRRWPPPTARAAPWPSTA